MSRTLSRQGVREGHAYQQSLRLTWQATPRNKFAGYVMQGRQCHCFWLIGGQGTAINQPEATSRALFGDQMYEVTLDVAGHQPVAAGGGRGTAPQVYDWNQQPFAAVNLPGVFEQAGYNYRNKLSQQIHHYAQTLRNYRGSAAYVTGTHNAKFGFTLIEGTQTNHYDNTQGPMLSLRTFNGLPNQVTYYAYPQDIAETLNPNLGIYAQDRWRLGRMSTDFGVRSTSSATVIPINSRCRRPTCRWLARSPAPRW